MLTSLVSFQQENIKKSKNSKRIDNIERENFHIFLTFSLEYTFLEPPPQPI